MGKVPATVNSDSGQEALRSPPRIARAKQLRTSRATLHLRAMHVVLFVCLPEFFYWAPESISRLYKYATWMPSCARWASILIRASETGCPYIAFQANPPTPFYCCCSSIVFCPCLVQSTLGSGGCRGSSDRFASMLRTRSVLVLDRLTSRQKVRPFVP